MLTLLKITFGLISCILAVYSLITDKFEVMPYMSLFVGLMVLMTGFSDLKENRKASAYTLFLASGFIIFVAIYTFIF
ncbi:DUF3953 domain-containing protein [Bacillus sp. CH126_4D]|uniref:YczI family protein n=1 Tax=unclassified Bacillus (in: firmicutes) TaxID=185979 RepID=UPI00124F0B3F|nr:MULTISPECIES: YczI family protein [unclassified Bacillus (in: firmicutes)]KAB2458207.1 DUF3953 domain-containing protein [Bacillus sp. CH140a_4T]KAB2475077.1 DUF3953 domain-containing protein [Bacillus sp. CH126_4D]